MPWFFITTFSNWFKNSRFFPDQSQLKQEPIATREQTFHAVSFFIFRVLWFSCNQSLLSILFHIVNFGSYFKASSLHDLFSVKFLSKASLIFLESVIANIGQMAWSRSEPFKEKVTAFVGLYRLKFSKFNWRVNGFETIKRLWNFPFVREQNLVGSSSRFLVNTKKAFSWIKNVLNWSRG